MSYSTEYCLELPSDFPDESCTQFRAIARRLLLESGDKTYWKEFAGASNLIAWRFRAMSDFWSDYVDSWRRVRASPSHEEIYRRDLWLFGMFTAGLSCLEATAYAIAAIATHPNSFGIAFGSREQKMCSPARLAKWLSGEARATSLVIELERMTGSSEWKLLSDFRNRMNHRSNIPTVNVVSMGAPLPPPNALHFASTSTTKAIEGDLTEFEGLCTWVADSLRSILDASLATFSMR